MPGKSMGVEERQTVKALFASDLTYKAIGKQLSRDRRTIKVELERPGVVAYVQVLKRELADEIDAMPVRMLTSTNDEDISRITAYQRIVVAGIAVDKMRLL